MKFFNLYVNGCSFSCAGGLHWDYIKNVYKEKFNIIINNHLDFSYPNILSKKLNLNLINDAVPGGSVNRLIRTTYQYIFDNIDNLKDTLFLLEIPPGWREEVFSNELNRTINLTISSVHSNGDKTDAANGFNENDFKKIHNSVKDYFYNFINYDDFERNKTMCNLLGLMSYIKLNKINYHILDTGDFHSFLTYFNKLNDDYNFIWIENKSFMNWIKDSNMLITNETNNIIEDPHLGIEGNKLIAEIIYKEIKKNEKD